ncbi:hypothetical protein TrVE_jg12272 [Triparma verrucosa]|uniref:Uncharacterized protein n=1 Tax=Triparma verrucosa TaxID=1606542 RepID=A0A9W7BKV4_9STRA|nr:hypothetical protein TrVE_jg12272 [Triparma verrucosa]
MSKRTSEVLSNAIGIPDPSSLVGRDDEEKQSKALSWILLSSIPQLEEVMISCIQTTSGDCSLVSLWLIL